MARVLTFAALALCAPGCIAQLQRGAALRHAAAVPFDGVALTGTYSALATDRTRYTLLSLTPDELCVAVTGQADPGTMLGTRFELRGVRFDDQPLRDAPVAENPVVQLLGAQTTDVPYQATVTDSIKDSRGQVIATASHTEQAWATSYLSEVQLCFAHPPLADARYLVVRPVVAPVAIGIGPMTGVAWAPRPGWFALQPGGAVSMDR